MKPSDDPTAMLRSRLGSGSLLFGLIITGFAIARLLDGLDTFASLATVAVGALGAAALVLGSMSIAASVPPPTARKRLAIAWTCIGLALLIQIVVLSIGEST
ncbi:hypothetical protein HDA40_001888 [Hamadaea flava]|uniref:Uncharacterized protein n=1 Tax=Hamadaea flava TaxID=1742688 RepID=A0ABV8LFB7_9ACTN|nr:hypothetical protein [Hamadaea flava]MCP2323381.1 hypothetical protein [Hamadaea flava]